MSERVLSSVTYEVDHNDKISRCRGDWDAFAEANGGEMQLSAKLMIGRSLWDFLHDPDTSEIYRRLMMRVRMTQQPISFPYRCDAPDRRRHFRMTCLPLSNQGLRFISDCLTEEVRPRPMPVASLPGSLFLCCSLCNRVGIGDRFLEIEEAAPEFDHCFNDGPLRVTYTVCEECEGDVMSRIDQPMPESSQAPQAQTPERMGRESLGAIGSPAEDVEEDLDCEEESQDGLDQMSSLPDLVVVGIGASAGGLEAITAFFRAVPDSPGVAFVLVQHLSPDFKSHMPELLSRHTPLPVHSVASGMRLEPNAIYLLPPGSLIRVRGRQLLLDPKVSPRSLTFPIDIFLESLAREYGPKAVAVILSGTGSDGSRGIIYVKEAGGLILVQNPESAQFDGMPNSALATETADYVLGPAEMPERLLAYLDHSPFVGRPRYEAADLTSAGFLDQIIEILAERRDHDFSGYRTKPLMRRILRRMSVVHAKSPESYLETLRSQQAEVDQLFSDLLINVTSFFRNEEAFRVLRDRVLPNLIAARAPDHTLRIWIAACSTGEEVYSVVTLLEEMAHQRSEPIPYRIFATDVDQEALAKASAGLYTENALAALSQEQLRFVFEPHHGQWMVRPELRARVVFAPHDMTTDPPFRRMDLILCRNVLIYFRTELQEEVLRFLHFSLAPGGYLFLGHSESLGSSTPYFDVIDPRWKIYQRNHEVRSVSSQQLYSAKTPHLRPLGSQRPAPAVRRPTPLESMKGRIAELESVLQRSFALGGSCLLVVDRRKEIQHVFGETSRVLQVGAGRATLNAQNLVVPGLKNAIGSALRRAESEKDPISYRRLALEDGALVDVVVTKLLGPSLPRTLFLALISFRTTDQSLEAQEAPGAVATVRIGELEEEINHLQDQLRGTLEDASTANEELQAANEELMASNEELQGTNEELQSVNEELHTINAEHQLKIQELAKLSEDMENLLKSTGIGTIFLDRGLLIRKFTPSVSEIVPLLIKDIGRPIGHIAPRLPGVDLDQISREAIKTGNLIERRVGAAAGPWLLRAHPYRASDGKTNGAVLTFVDLKELASAELSTERPLAQVRVMAEILRDGLLLQDQDGGVITYASGRCDELFGPGSASDLRDGARWVARIHFDDRERIANRRALPLNGAEDVLEYRLSCDGQIRWVSEQRFPIRIPSADGPLNGIILRDITEAKENLRQLRALATALDHQANSDLLTGLHNRRGLARELQDEVERLRRNDGRLFAVLCDAERLEEINRAEGQSRGDALLQRVAESLTRALRPEDHLGRIGGSRFLALLQISGSRDPENAIAALRDAVSDPSCPEGQVVLTALDVTTGYGSLEEIVLEADRQRAPGRAAAKLSFSNERLRDLLDMNTYTVLRQPIHRLSDGAVIAQEFFSRSRILGLAEPQQFLRTAESLKILTSVDLLCLESCARAAGGVASLTTHLNILPQTLLVTPTAELTRRIRETAGLSSQVILEVSTARFARDPESLARCADELRAEGILVGLDDVGYERGALETLVALEPAVIKIDGSLFDQALRDGWRRRQLERLIRVAKSITSRVAVKGLETKSAFQLAVDLGVQEGQGYLWEHPLALGEAT